MRKFEDKNDNFQTKLINYGQTILVDSITSKNIYKSDSESYKVVIGDFLS